MDFNKILTEHLHEKGYLVSLHKKRIKIRFGSETIMLFKEKDNLVLEEWVVANNSITINNYPQMNRKATTIGNIHDPKLFDALFRDLERRKRCAQLEADDTTREVNRVYRDS